MKLEKERKGNGAEGEEQGKKQVVIVVGRPGPYFEVFLLSSSVQGSCGPYPPFPHLPEESGPELPTSPVLSLGDKAGKAHNQPASTNSYTAFKLCPP